MPKVAVKDDMVATGKQLANAATRFTLNGLPVVLVGDPITPHDNGPHTNATMIEGTSFMTWNGVQVCVQGNKASCLHTTLGTSIMDIPNN